MRAGAAPGGMAGLAVRPIPELALRVGSAAVLGALVLAATIAGTPAFELLVALAAGAMAWEWDRVCGRGRAGAMAWVLGAAVLAAIALAGAAHHGAALTTLAVGTLAAYGVARAARRDGAAWLAAGVLAIGLACVALVWLRAAPHGLVAVLWLLGVVWTIDIAAYAVGRSIGGPKLAPSISPGKTWAGLIGAMGFAALFGLAAGFALGLGAWPALLALALAPAAQASDLMVSRLKRRFGQKDASGLVPGHGGVLDRFDSFVLAAPALAVAVLATGGGPWEW